METQKRINELHERICEGATHQQQDEVQVGEALKEGLRVPAESERGVDQDRPGTLEGGREQFDAAFQQHRDVEGVVRHLIGASP